MNAVRRAAENKRCLALTFDEISDRSKKMNSLSHARRNFLQKSICSDVAVFAIELLSKPTP
jgi:hypothetical protein